MLFYKILHFFIILRFAIEKQREHAPSYLHPGALLFAEAYQYINIVFGRWQSAQAPRLPSSSGRALPQLWQVYAGLITILSPSARISSVIPRTSPYFSRISFGIVICPFWLIFAIVSTSKSKSAQTEAYAPKNANPDCCNTKLDKHQNTFASSTHLVGICAFAKFIRWDIRQELGAKRKPSKK